MEENVTMGKAVYDQPELNSWDPNGAKREPTSIAALCLYTYAMVCIQSHVYTQIHTHTYYNKVFFKKIQVQSTGIGI